MNCFLLFIFYAAFFFICTCTRVYTKIFLNKKIYFKLFSSLLCIVERE